MAVQLTITEEGEPRSRFVRTFLMDRIVIGRARSSDVCLPDMAVSTRHAEIRVSGNDYVAVDLESRNGTAVNGKTLLAYRPKTLRNGDVISVANFKIAFQLGASVGREEPRETSILQAREMVSNVLARSGAHLDLRYLVVLSGPHRASRFSLPTSGALVVGRGREVDIELDDRDISRRHAEISVNEGVVTVQDIGGRGGIAVNGESVEHSALNAGDRLTIGSVTLALEHSADRSLNAIFEAPEEDTSSYAISMGSALVASSEDAPSKEMEPPEPDDVSSPPPIGPSDPLAPDEGFRPRPPDSPKTEENDHTDIGLILVGAIIVLAAVAGLVYLYS